jgi:proteasome beta subunit
VDEIGASVFSVDALGGATKEEEIVATGSGSPGAYGVLEDRFHKDMKEEEAVALSIRAIKAAMRRDAGSGEGIHVVVITKEAYREIPDEEVAQKLAAITT